jgi:hypothetical protein
LAVHIVADRCACERADASSYYRIAAIIAASGGAENRAADRANQRAGAGVAAHNFAGARIGGGASGGENAGGGENQNLFIHSKSPLLTMHDACTRLVVSRP